MIYLEKNIKEVTLSDFKRVKKDIKSMIKKLEKHNINYTFKELDQQVKKIEYFKSENVFNGRYTEQRTVFLNSEIVKTQRYVFNFDKIKLGEYEIIAIVQHNRERNIENTIHYTNDNFNNYNFEKLKTINCNCDHCSSNRYRKKTIILFDPAKNEYKQVGSTCLKMYTSFYNCLEFLSFLEFQAQTIINDRVVCGEDFTPSKIYNYLETDHYLSKCIHLINSEGYKKGDTKHKAFYDLKIEPSKDDIKLAKKVMEFFITKDFDTSFLHNIKVSLQQKYTELNGFIAYAYEQYKKDLEKHLQDEKEKENNKKFDFIGNIKDKITIDCTLTDIHEFHTNYTYYGELNYFYTFKDEEGNIFKWKTQKDLDDLKIKVGQKISLKGTIKAHDTYKHQKQNILTRCKIAS